MVNHGGNGNDLWATFSMSMITASSLCHVDIIFQLGMCESTVWFNISDVPRCSKMFETHSASFTAIFIATISSWWPSSSLWPSSLWSSSWSLFLLPPVVWVVILPLVGLVGWLQRACHYRFSRMRSKGSRFTLGLGAEAVFARRCATVRNRSQPFATVRNRSQPFASGRVSPVWPCQWRVLQLGSLLEVSNAA